MATSAELSATARSHFDWTSEGEGHGEDPLLLVWRATGCWEDIREYRVGVDIIKSWLCYIISITCLKSLNLISHHPGNISSINFFPE
jgi:hypothetical protein